MTDRVKVVDGLTDLKRFLPSTMWEPINDALALLKEQQKEIEILKAMGLKMPEVTVLTDKPIYKVET